MTSSGIFPWLCSYQHFIQSLCSDCVSSGSQRVRKTRKLESASSIPPVELSGGFGACSGTRPFLLQSLSNGGWKEANPVTQRLIPIRNWDIPRSPAGCFCLQRVARRGLGLAGIDHFSLWLHCFGEWGTGVHIPPNECTAPDRSPHSLGPSLDQRLSMFAFDCWLL